MYLYRRFPTGCKHDIVRQSHQGVDLFSLFSSSTRSDFLRKLLKAGYVHGSDLVPFPLNIHNTAAKNEPLKKN